MHILDIFRSRSVNQWYEVHEEAPIAMGHIREYIKSLFRRIEAFQYISLRPYDLRNAHYVDMKTSFTKNVYGSQTANNVKITKQFFKLLSKRIHALIAALEDGAKTADHAARSLETILRDLTTQQPLEGQLLQDVKDIAAFLGALEQLRKNLREQVAAAHEMEQAFRLFLKIRGIANEENENILRAYGQVIRDQEHLEYIMRREFPILLKVEPPRDVAIWRIETSSAVERMPIFKELEDVNKESENMIRLAEDRQITLFHANETNQLFFPLQESRYKAGFFVCTEEERYALTIKRNQSMDGGIYIQAHHFRMPESLFRQLFIHDKNEGKAGDEASVAAYDHAYVLPVSRFPLFNYYLRKRIISAE